MEVEVIFPYDPLQDDELRLEVGDIITLVEQLEKGWGKGVLNQVSGVFPDNFVRLLTPSRKLMRSQERTDMKPQHHAIERRETGGRRCRVVYSYVPQHEDELSLCEGDIINILQEVEEGWWKGILKGKIGMFPSNFVEECEQGEDSRSNIYSMEPRNTEINGNPQTSDTTLNNTKDTNAIHPSPNSAFHPVNNPKDAKGKPSPDKSPKMDTNSREKERLENSSSTERDKITINIGDRKSKTNGTSVKKTSSNSAQVIPPQLPPKPVREMARVLFPYMAEHDDEMELIEGDLITILSKDLEDKGWWKGEIGGKVGVFPDNFVQLISQEEIIKPPRPEKRPTISKAKAVRTSSTFSSSSAPIEKDQTPPPPPLPNKKLSPPPLPKEKKPSQESINGTENSTSEPNSLTLTRETPLVHVMRPKGPSNRRPPSQFLRENKISVTTDEDAFSSEEDSSSMTKTDSSSSESKTLVTEPAALEDSSPRRSSGSSPPPEAARPPWLKELKVKQIKKRQSGIFSQVENDVGLSSANVIPVVVGGGAIRPPSLPSRLSPPSLKSPRLPVSPMAVSPRRSPVKEEDHPDGAGTHDSAHIVPAQPIEKKSTMNGIDNSLASKVDFIYKDLVPKVRSLEIRLEEQNLRHVSQIQLLTKELDEERKERACLQIEVDRLKKLLTAQYAHV